LTSTMSIPGKGLRIHAPPSVQSNNNIFEVDF